MTMNFKRAHVEKSSSSIVDGDENEELEQEERMFKTTIKLNVIGHLVGAGTNEIDTNIIYRENAVEVKIPREYVIVNESSPLKKKW